MISKFCKITPTLPYLYGVVKTHKVNFPLRPIISSVGSCSYYLSKWLVGVLSPLVGTISASNVKNNIDLKIKLDNLNCTYDFIMLSFDVTSLFTRVPVDSLLDYFRNEFEDHNFPVSCDNLIKLINICVKDSKFIFNSEYYSQKFGMAMGNPLSPVLSNLYVEFLENYELSIISFNDHTLLLISPSCFF